MFKALNNIVLVKNNEFFELLKNINEKDLKSFYTTLDIFINNVVKLIINYRPYLNKIDIKYIGLIDENNKLWLYNMIDIKFLIRAGKRLRKDAKNDFNRIVFKWKEEDFNIIKPSAYTTFNLPFYVNDVKRNLSISGNIIIDQLMATLNRPYGRFEDGLIR